MSLLDNSSLHYGDYLKGINDDTDSNTDYSDMPPLIPIDDGDSNTDYSDIPPLIPIDDDDSDTDYSDMPPLIPTDDDDSDTELDNCRIIFKELKTYSDV
jgi:nitrate reductase cytochrome c-type subunit